MRKTHHVLTLALVLAACGGDPNEPVAPRSGAIRVLAGFTGADRPGTYSVIVAGQSVFPGQDGIATTSRLAPGNYSVLFRVAKNCQVEGDNPRTVTVSRGQETTVMFSAACTATTSSVRVTTATTGIDLDPNGYTLHIDGFDFIGARVQREASLPGNGAVTLSGVPVGNQSLTLRSVAYNCDAAGSNPRAINVVGAETLTVAFNVVCRTAPSQLAYVAGSADGTRHIYVINANGTGARRLTGDPFSEDDPAWSPDGRKIALTSERDRNREIYVFNTDDSTTVRLTDEGAADYQPTWSPGGSKIAFVSERVGLGEIFVMNADGTAVTRLTNNATRAHSPAWSPDGRQIAFTSDRDVTFDIYVMNADGSGAARLTTDGSSPAWSRDGTRLAYTGRVCPGYPYACYSSIVVKVGSELAKPLRFAIGERPSWSPEGRLLAYSGFDCDYYFVECAAVAVRIARLDGTDIIDVAAGFNPAWRP